MCNTEIPRDGDQVFLLFPSLHVANVNFVLLGTQGAVRETNCTISSGRDVGGISQLARWCLQ